MDDARSLQLNINSAINAMLNKSEESFRKEINLWLKKIDQSSRSIDRGKAKVYREVVSVSKKEMIAHYKERRKSGGLANYRFADKGRARRYSGGKMLNLLRSDALIKTNGSNIYFISKSRLDKIAPQWYRLNFGSGGGVANYVDTGRMRIRIGSKTLSPGKKVDFRGWGKGETVTMPEGFSIDKRFASSAEAWKGAYRRGGKTKKPGFYLGSVSKPKGSRSKSRALNSNRKNSVDQIQGYGFLEVGARAINREFGNGVSRLLTDWRRSVSKIPKKKVTIR